MTASAWVGRAAYLPGAQAVYVCYPPTLVGPCRYFEYQDVPMEAWRRMCSPQDGWRYFREAVQDRYLHFEVGRARFETLYATGLAGGVATARWQPPDQTETT